MLGKITSLFAFMVMKWWWIDDGDGMEGGEMIKTIDVLLLACQMLCLCFWGYLYYLWLLYLCLLLLFIVITLSLSLEREARLDIESCLVIFYSKQILLKIKNLKILVEQLFGRTGLSSARCVHLSSPVSIHPIELNSNKKLRGIAPTQHVE